MSDIESRIQQIASVLGQLDDSQVPRNIRITAKESVDKWLLNKNKEMDLRLGMTASMLDDIFNDPNLPLHFVIRLNIVILNFNIGNLKFLFNIA